MFDALVEYVSVKIGATIPATRFLLSLFVGYPFGFLHRALIHGQAEDVHHMFFALTGLSVYFFNFGLLVVHPCINIAVVFILLKYFGGSKFSVAFAFLFNTVYLTYGYSELMTVGYHISWTTPHCVLTLRLTALVLDYYDGKKNKKELTSDQRENYLESVPSLLSMFGHAFFIGGMLAGPQFGMRKYLSFVRGEFSAQMNKDAVDVRNKNPPSSISPAISRLLLGILYVAVFQTGNMFFTDEFLFTTQYKDLGLVTKCLYILVWGQLYFRKYIGVWLICEGTCILIGISYNGKDENGNILWDGVTNVKLYQSETACTFRTAIESFNHNTNNWMFRYIYKRLRFLGNKYLSQALTLLYLALWHGLFSGYYMNFFLEFIMVNSENQAAVLVTRVPLLHSINTSPTLKPLLWLVKKVIVNFSISYALVSFCLLSFNKYMQIYASIWYIGHVVFLLYPILNFILMQLLVPSRKSEKVSIKKKE